MCTRNTSLSTAVALVFEFGDECDGSNTGYVRGNAYGLAAGGAAAAATAAAASPIAIASRRNLLELGLLLRTDSLEEARPEVAVVSEG